MNKMLQQEAGQDKPETDRCLIWDRLISGKIAAQQLLKQLNSIVHEVAV